MRIMVMDGQGGGVGRSLLEALKERFPEAELIAVGTNATATANMMKEIPVQIYFHILKHPATVSFDFVLTITQSPTLCPRKSSTFMTCHKILADP